MGYTVIPRDVKVDGETIKYNANNELTLANILKFAEIKDVLLYSNDTEKSTNSYGYIKVKEFTISSVTPNPTKCVLQVDVKTDSPPYAYFKVERNSTLVSETQITSSSYYNSQVEIDIANNDTISIYLRIQGSGFYAYLKNLRIYSKNISYKLLSLSANTIL